MALRQAVSRTRVRTNGALAAFDGKLFDIQFQSLEADRWIKTMYRVCEHVRITHGKDGAILLDVRRGHVFILNPVGSRILELIERGSQGIEIATLIAEEFQVGRERVENDLNEFFAALKVRGLILNFPHNGARSCGAHS